MKWYWIAALGLAWIASLYVYSYWANRTTPNRVDALADGILLYGYILLFASLPALVIWLGLINVAWYVWVLLAIEAICLFVLAVIVGERKQKKPGFFVPDMTFQDKIAALIAFGLILIVAPLGLGLHFLSLRFNRRQRLKEAI